MVQVLAPIFTPDATAPTTDNPLFGESLYIFQFLTLYKLWKEAIKVAHGSLVVALYKSTLPVFHNFHRTKYR